jgi:uncharacterized protein YnzC (UPF0291/DUF896 family)
MGWSTYFVFALGAINTLTITYFLAIDNYPVLKNVFPTFEQYVVIMIVVGIPVLIMLGYAHYKKTKAFRSEMDVFIESNPYQRRNIVNSTILVSLTMKINEMMFKLAKNEKLTSKEIEEVEKLQNEVKEFTDDRKLSPKKDLEFVKKNLINEFSDST